MNRNVENYLASKEVENKQEETKIKSLITFLKETTDMVKSGSKEALKNAQTFISEKGDSIKEYLSINGTALAYKAMQSFLALLLAVSIFLATTGCGNNKTLLGNNSVNNNISIPDKFEQLEERPIDEIEETGITANDVLAAYDELSVGLVKLMYGDSQSRKELGDKFDLLDAQFISISPVMDQSTITKDDNMFDSIDPRPFYGLERLYTPDYSWNKIPNEQYYTPNLPTMQNSVYKVNFKAFISLEKEKDIMEFNHFGVSQEAMENMLEAYNKQKFEVTTEAFKDAPNRGHCYNFLGQMVYEPITIDRELIKNSSEEQLWALYNMIRSMISINVYSETPIENKEYEIEHN